MFDYLAFGGVLRSEVALVDFVPATCDSADWMLRVATQPLEPVQQTLRGMFEPLPGIVLRLHDHPSGRRLEGDKIGSWDIVDGGRQIVWWAETRQQKEFFRAMLLGPVLSLVLEQHGVLALHGSAVNMGGFGVAFLAPKLCGKSTLALALTLAGARLITDDIVAVDAGNPAVVRPGSHGVRLFSDSVERLNAAAAPLTLVGDAKFTVTAMPLDFIQTDAVPLSALYLLEPALRGVSGPAAIRELLSPSEATIGLALRAKLADDLVGLPAAAARLERLAHLATAVPVYRLHVARDWDRIAECVEQLRQWHSNIQTPTVVAS